MEDSEREKKTEFFELHYIYEKTSKQNWQNLHSQNAPSSTPTRFTSLSKVKF